MCSSDFNSVIADLSSVFGKKSESERDWLSLWVLLVAPMQVKGCWSERLSVCCPSSYSVPVLGFDSLLAGGDDDILCFLFLVAWLDPWVEAWCAIIRGLYC